MFDFKISGTAVRLTLPAGYVLSSLGQDDEGHTLAIFNFPVALAPSVPSTTGLADAATENSTASRPVPTTPPVTSTPTTPTLYKTETGIPIWSEYLLINKAQALWTRNKSDISDEEYREFYKHVSHDFADPLLWGHNHVEGKNDYTSLLYIPTKAPWDMMNRDHKHGLKLYVQRVFAAKV